jgi:hypothetical protein
VSFESDFLGLMNDTVRVYALSSVDGYGNPTYAAAGSTYEARYVRKQELVRTFEGIEELAQAKIYIASTSTFSPHSRVTVNGSTLGPLMALQAFPDESGVHHLVGFLG